MQMGHARVAVRCDHGGGNPGCQTRLFLEDSGHMGFIEETDKYLRSVSDFIANVDQDPQ